jgi:hypothetical protein
MTCEKAEELLSAYLDDMLAPQLSQEVAAHVEGCASCREILADYRRSDASIATYLRAGQIEPPASLRDRIFDSTEYAAILRHAAEADGAREAARTRAASDTPRRSAGPPGWARGALAAAVALLFFGSALLIKQGLLYSATPSARSTTVLNGNPGTHPLAAGARVVYERGGALWSVLVSGNGQADQLTPKGIRVGAWSASLDGTQVAYVDLATGRIHVIRSDDQDDQATSSVAITADGAVLAWSPDGLRIAYLAPAGGSTTLRIVNADGSGDLAVDGSGAVSGAPVWSGDAAFVAYVQDGASGQTLWVYNAATKVSREVSAVDPTGATARISASGVRWLNDAANPRVTWATTNGTAITGVYAASATAGGAVRETPAGTAFAATDLSWSPDASSAAFVTSAGKLSIWTPTVGTRSVTAVTYASGTPAWSADGRSVAVVADGGVTVVKVATGATQTAVAQGGVVSIAFAPAGTGLAVASASGVTIYAEVTGAGHTVAGAAERGALAWTIAG